MNNLQTTSQTMKWPETQFDSIRFFKSQFLFKTQTHTHTRFCHTLVVISWFKHVQLQKFEEIINIIKLLSNYMYLMSHTISFFGFHPNIWRVFSAMCLIKGRQMLKFTHFKAIYQEKMTKLVSESRDRTCNQVETKIDIKIE